jgi:phosphohistidine phosphatase
MPVRLYFLRHGAAADRDAWHGDDADRPLTDEGRERIAREARTIARLGLALDVIVTSPLVRARQTAAIVAEALEMREKLVEDRRLAPGFDIVGLAGILETHRDAAVVMVVGHEPSMSATIGRLIGGAAIDFKKGSLARVDLLDDSHWRGMLVWLVPPKILISRM